MVVYSVLGKIWGFLWLCLCLTVSPSKCNLCLVWQVFKSLHLLVTPSFKHPFICQHQTVLKEFNPGGSAQHWQWGGWKRRALIFLYFRHETSIRIFQLCLKHLLFSPNLHSEYDYPLWSKEILKPWWYNSWKASFFTNSSQLWTWFYPLLLSGNLPWSH